MSLLSMCAKIFLQEEEPTPSTRVGVRITEGANTRIVILVKGENTP